MTHFKTEEDYQIFLMRLEKELQPPTDDTPDPGPESNLVKKIRASIKENGFIGFCAPEHPMIKRILPPGWPD